MHYNLLISQEIVRIYTQLHRPNQHMGHPGNYGLKGSGPSPAHRIQLITSPHNNHPARRVFWYQIILISKHPKLGFANNPNEWVFAQESNQIIGTIMKRTGIIRVIVAKYKTVNYSELRIWANKYLQYFRRKVRNTFSI